MLVMLDNIIELSRGDCKVKRKELGGPERLTGGKKDDGGIE